MGGSVTVPCLTQGPGWVSVAFHCACTAQVTWQMGCLRVSRCCSNARSGFPGAPSDHSHALILFMVPFFPPKVGQTAGQGPLLVGRCSRKPVEHTTQELWHFRRCLWVAFWGPESSSGSWQRQSRAGLWQQSWARVGCSQVQWRQTAHHGQTSAHFNGMQVQGWGRWQEGACWLASSAMQTQPGARASQPLPSQDRSRASSSLLWLAAPPTATTPGRRVPPRCLPSLPRLPG